jgi:3-isopropylmalate/(R)-2-methylmalate dehydratase small subunit
MTHLRPAGFGGQVNGRARVFGDDVNTDYIISSSRKRKTIDPSALAPYLLEGVSSAFAASVQPGDLIVAGRNFGCGSAMEVAVTVIQAPGIRAVVARSFARSFFRNAINNGLLVVECDTSSFQEGDGVSIDVSDAAVRVQNLTRDVAVAAVPLPPVIREILARGGLVKATPGIFF